MKDFSKQLENLRREITGAIIGLLRIHGLTELEFPESGTVPNVPDSVYVIFFDDDGDPFECIITKVSVMGDSLYLTAREKHDGYIFRTEPIRPLGSQPYMAQRNPACDAGTA